MTDNEQAILKSRLAPSPHDIKFPSEDVLALKDQGPVQLITTDGDDEYRGLVLTLFQRYWGVTPRVDIAVNTAACGLRRGGYEVKVDGNAVAIRASEGNGVKNALRTMRQLAEPRRGVERFDHYLIPAVEIRDEPALDFRGLHFCWFPETQGWEIEKALRLAAYYKFNHIVLEFWGVFPFECHPCLCWDQYRVSRDEVKELIHLGKELGVTLVPQMNILGHASGSRYVSGKHVVLDQHPELQSLFEPEGWSWCLSNENTKRILTEAVIELYDFFEKPGFFHLGCDEAEGLGTCFSCRRRPLHDLVKEYLLHFFDLLKKRGGQSILWHDMFLNFDDPRWKPYTALGRPEQNLNRLIDELPGDVIIADWQYDYPKIDGEEPAWPTMTFFKNKGFQVLACPWLDSDGMFSLGRIAQRERFKGMLGTTWHKLNGKEMHKIFYHMAQAAWGVCEYPEVKSQLRFHHHLRQIQWDMAVKDYPQTGCVQWQVPEASAL